MNDKELLKNLKSHHPDAFKKLVELHQDRVINICFSFLHNEEDAEDIAQEVFVEIYKSVAKFREEAKLSTWIYRLAVAKSIDFIRKKKRKKRFTSIRNILRMEDYAEKIPDHKNRDPLERLEQQEQMRILQNTINSLAENQKIAITLSKCEGFSNRAIARIMETTLPAVEALIDRAKKNLQKRLHHYYEKHLPRK